MKSDRPHGNFGFTRFQPTMLVHETGDIGPIGFVHFAKPSPIAGFADHIASIIEAAARSQ